MFKIYTGILKSAKRDVLVESVSSRYLLDPENIKPTISLHGFEWGCNCISTAQLALSLIKDITNDDILALKLHGKLREEFLQYLPSRWKYTSIHLLDILKELKAEKDFHSWKHLK